MVFQDVQMDNKEILHGEKIGEIVRFIINKFSEEGMSCDEAKIILEETKSIIGEYSKVQTID